MSKCASLEGFCPLVACGGPPKPGGNLPARAVVSPASTPGPLAMSARSLALVVAFRRGWQWPFRDGDTVRVYREGDRVLLAEIPASFLMELVHHYLMGVALQARVADHLSPLPAPDPLPLAKASAPRLPAATGRRLRGRVG